MPIGFHGTLTRIVHRIVYISRVVWLNEERKEETKRMCHKRKKRQLGMA